jgi:RIO kinase 2
MKLDPTVMKTMSKEDYRVLASVEIGMKTHDLVPAALCMQIAKLRHGGANKVMGGLLRDKLLSHDKSKGYDGYRLTNSGYDILALRNLFQRGIVSALGDKIGVGKESDIYIACNKEGKQLVLKFHRLGRTSFRAVRNKRDYLQKGKDNAANNWLFMSRLSALKEFAFMKSLDSVGYPTPEPLGHSRHVVAMTLVRGCPLYQIRARSEVSVDQAASIYEQTVSLAARLAKHGLVHCDLNEFNLMVDLSGIQSKLNPDNDVGGHYVRSSGAVVRGPGALSHHAILGKDTGPDGTSLIDGTGEIITEDPIVVTSKLPNGEPVPIVTLIDFPQMISTNHPNAKEMYERDVDCLIKFFARKLNVVNGDGDDDMRSGWRWEDVTGEAAGDSSNVAGDAEQRLDGELKASGFSEANGRRDLELYYFEKNTVREENRGEEDGEEEEDSDDDSEGEEGEGGEQQEVAFENDDAEEESDDDDEDDSVPNLVESTAALATADVDDSDTRSVASSRSHISYAQQKAADKTIGAIRKKVQTQNPKGRGGAVYKLGNSNKKLVKGKKTHQEKIRVKGGDGWD